MRLVYNTSFHVENQIEPAFIKVMKEFYIPFVKAKGLCSDILFSRIITHEEEGKSLSIQLVFLTEKDYTTFIDFYREKLLNTLIELFGKDLLHFSTTLEEIEN